MVHDLYETKAERILVIVHELLGMGGLHMIDHLV